MLEPSADFGRRIGVSRQCVADYVKRGQIGGDAVVRQGRSVLIDVEKATAQLARRLDPGKRLTSGKAKLAEPVEAEAPEPKLGYLAPMADYSEPADRGMVAMALYFVHNIGAVAALAAMEAGAPIKVGLRVERTVTVHAMELAETFMQTLKVSTDPMLYMMEAVARVDWKMQAEALGQPYEPKKFEAWARKSKD